MGTATKSIAEQYGDRRATWYFYGSLSDVSVTGSTFTIPYPAVSAKFVYSGKNQASVDFLYAEPVLTGLSGYLSQCYALSERAWSTDSYKSLSRTSDSTTIPAQNTSNYFKASNKTTRTLSFSYKCTHVFCQSHRVVSGSYYADYDGSIQGLSSDFTLASANITLNAPPIVACGEPTYANPHYAGLGAYSVTVTSASAQYGGDVQSITLTIGNDTQSQSYSSSTVTNKTLTVTPSVAGTYTPTITVTDTRGQITTVNLAQITVNAYTAPSISFDLQRTNGSGIPNAEGEYGLVTASISYTDAIANLTQPTVSVRDADGNLVVSSATWYTTWTAQSGVQNAVNWTNYNPQSPATLYAVVSATGSTLSPNESYTISITPTDNQGGIAQTITQTLSTGFFTIDFKAGGKEIAFGAPANDDVTDYPEGLFKCAMSFKLKENLFWVGTRSEYEDAVDAGKMPEHTIVILTDEDTDDYVVEQGTGENWYYRKWNSGKVELWGYFSATYTSYITNAFVIGGSTLTKYPFAITSPIAQATLEKIGTGGGIVTYDYRRTDYWSGIANGVNQSPAQGQSRTIIWQVYVIANWK